MMQVQPTKEGNCCAAHGKVGDEDLERQRQGRQGEKGRPITPSSNALNCALSRPFVFLLLLTFVFLLLLTMIIVIFSLVLGWWKHPPVNDECKSAIQLKLDNGDFVFRGTFEDANPDPGGFGIAGSGDTNGPVVWFKFEGTGSNVYIELKSDGSASFALYEGESCNDLYESTSQSPFGKDGMILLQEQSGSNDIMLAYFGDATVKTKQGTQYYLYLMTCSCEGGGHCLQYPKYRIAAKQVDGPVNDVCESAVELEYSDDGDDDNLSNNFVHVSLEGASANGNEFLTYEWKNWNFEQFPAGVWYKINPQTLSYGTTYQVMVNPVGKYNPYRMYLFRGARCDDSLTAINIDNEDSNSEYPFYNEPFYNEHYPLYLTLDEEEDFNGNGNAYYYYIYLTTEQPSGLFEGVFFEMHLMRIHRGVL